ncbi:MAG: hypothetical protein ACK5L3_04395 [Oscillospiraceae bacterium]
MRKNGFLTFCFSFLPGCGQMYQGYMRRGVSLLFWFCVLLFISVLLNVGPLSIFLLVAWAFSFFDSFNIRALSNEQRAAFADDYLPSAAWLQQKNITPGALKGKGGKILGWALVAAGVIIIYSNFIMPILWRLSDRFPLFVSILQNLPTLVVALAILGAGLWLLFFRKGGQPPKDDIVPYNDKGEHE